MNERGIQWRVEPVIVFSICAVNTDEVISYAPAPPPPSLRPKPDDEELEMIVPDLSSRTIQDLLSLTGRVGVVTGGGRGIGLAIAQRLAEAGADIVIADIDEAAASEASAVIGDTHGHPSIGVGIDASNPLDMAKLAELAVNELGGIHIWVNNAGIYPVTPLTDLTEDQWDRVINVNLKGTFLGAREAAKQMIAAETHGVIINIASTAGYKAHRFGGADYVASKNGVRGLTKALAAELGPFGIRALAIAPMTITTPGIQAVREDPALRRAVEYADSLPKPLGREGVPDDIARVALFCACDLSLIMTGSTILADGGQLSVI